jgi:hypothetical protein
MREKRNLSAAVSHRLTEEDTKMGVETADLTGALVQDSIIERNYLFYSSCQKT